MKAWGVQWRSKNNLDGRTEHLIWSPLFHTRGECRQYISERFGYLRKRPDLRVEPHGWRIPRAVRVVVALAGQETRAPNDSRAADQTSKSPEAQG